MLIKENGGWTGDDIEERLIDAAELWMRTPASGFGPGRRSPFAADAPWHLLTKDVRAGSVMDAWRQEIEEKAVADASERGVFVSGEAYQVRGLSRDEVGRRDEASEWLLLVPERDRPLVVAAVWWQASTGRRPDWGMMLDVVGLQRGKNGVRMRFNRAMGALAKVLNASSRSKAA